MGYGPPPPPIRLNLDRFGMPRDYASYVWVTYKRIVTDDSPARRAFLDHPGTGHAGLVLFDIVHGERAYLPEADLSLMGTSWK